MSTMEEPEAFATLRESLREWRREMSDRIDQEFLGHPEARQDRETYNISGLMRAGGIDEQRRLIAQFVVVPPGQNGLLVPDALRREPVRRSIEENLAAAFAAIPAAHVPPPPSAEEIRTAVDAVQKLIKESTTTIICHPDNEASMAEAVEQLRRESADPVLVEVVASPFMEPGEAYLVPPAVETTRIGEPRWSA